MSADNRLCNDNLAKLVADQEAEKASIAQQLEDFVALTDPLFPLHPLGADNILLFSKFTSIEEGPPRFILVRDGAQIAYWDLEVPPVEEVLAARDAAGPITPAPGS